MDTPPVIPPPAAPAAPKQNRTVLYVIAGVLIACCACFGLIGLAIGFGGPILQALGISF